MGQKLIMLVLSWYIFCAGSACFYILRLKPLHTEWPGPEVIKLFFMLNSTEHEISTAHKNYNSEK